MCAEVYSSGSGRHFLLVVKIALSFLLQEGRYGGHRGQERHMTQSL